MIKYAPNVNWTKPFVESAQKYVSLGKIKRIRGYEVGEGKIERGFGSLTRNGNKYTVSLLLFENAEGKSMVLGIVLEALAHELAHLKYWEHTPKHFALQAEIQVEFSKVAKSLGIKDMFKRLKRYKIDRVAPV